MTKCLHSNNGGEVFLNTVFKVRVVCGWNYTITRPTNEDSAQTRRFYIDTGGYEHTFEDFISAAESICPIVKYEIYWSATNNAAYKLSGRSYSIPGDLTKTITIGSALTSNWLGSVTFYIRGEWTGTSGVSDGAHGFSAAITYEVVCGSEALSIDTWSNGTAKKYNYTYTEGWKGGGYLSGTIPWTTFSQDILTNQSLCGVVEFELRESNYTSPTNQFLTSETRVVYDYINKNIVVSHGENFYDEIGIRAWTTARNNSDGYVGGVTTVYARDLYIDYSMFIDICGWEMV